jgi:hypothetical protein
MEIPYRQTVHSRFNYSSKLNPALDDTGKSKGKVAPVNAMWLNEGSGVIASLILNLDTTWWQEVSFMPRSHSDRETDPSIY